jgi:rhamnosyltransferase subunit B
MKILVIAIGSDGDVNPMLEIAQELSGRGHRVEVLANEHFAYKCERAGLTFVEMGSAEHFQQAIDSPELWDKRKGFSAVWKLTYKNLPLAYDLIKSRIDPGNTVVVGSTLSVAARVLQEVHGVSLCTVHLAPTCILSKLDPPRGPDLSLSPRAPRWLKALYIDLIDHLVIDSVCRDELNSFRRQFSLSPVSRIFSKWLHSPEKVICAFPEWFAAPQADWPENSLCTGFPLPRPSSLVLGQSLSEETERFLEAGAPPVVFTAGSAMNHSAAYFEKALAVVTRENIRAIFVSKFPAQIPLGVAVHPQVHHALYEPFDLLFPRASAVAHHGGIGTSAQCLQAGVKQFITPFSHDQFDNANRLVKLGVAEELPVSKSAQHWRKVVGRVLRGQNYVAACLEAQSRLRASSRAVGLIAEEIEKLALPLLVCR